MAIKDYNSTASDNTTISGIGIQGTNAVSNFDGAFRQIMADVANWTDTDTIASAATTDLSTVEGTYITVSGTITITAFGTLKSGMFKFLKFDGALTLTHNATSLILPRAANITTVAGDTAAFVSLGSGNWRCLFFQRTTAASGRSDLGLGTAAVKNTGSSGDAVPLLNVANTWTGGQQVVQAADNLTTTYPLRVRNSAGTQYIEVGAYGASVSGIDYTITSAAGIILTPTNGVMIGTTAEYASDAFLHVAVASDTKGALTTETASTAARKHWYIRNGNGEVGSVSTSGSGTTFATSSDERLKANFADFDAAAILSQIDIYQYQWRVDGEIGYGPKAQDLHAIFPQAVLVGSQGDHPGDESFIPWGYDASKLVPLLIKDAQQKSATIEALEARIAALEGVTA